MSDIKAEAEALGIKVDGRWSDDRIAEEIAKANADRAAAANAASAKPKMAEVRVLYDTWDGDGIRNASGSIVKLPIEAARVLLAEGKAERVDVLPEL